MQTSLIYGGPSAAEQWVSQVGRISIPLRKYQSDRDRNVDVDEGVGIGAGVGVGRRTYGYAYIKCIL